MTAPTASFIPAPELPYKPPRPQRFKPRIGLVGCGGITRQHLKAYQLDGYEVVAVCDLNEAVARQRIHDFGLRADVYTDHHALLAREDVDVVDAALHPAPRAGVIADALDAGKHVLSQKPFVQDLKVGRALVERAQAKGLRLAVNQNGRWAPYVAYAHALISAGYLGPLTSVTMALNWDHTWISGTAFERVRHVILYDYAIHWFDFLTLFFGETKPVQVQAVMRRVHGQGLAPAMLAQIIVAYPEASAVLSFNGHSRFGGTEHWIVAGTQGTFEHRGAVTENGTNTLHTANGQADIALEGVWMPDGFRGTMGELLCAIEEDREPSHSAHSNLQSLELCFAAMQSAEQEGQPIQPGAVTVCPQ
ncbi:MAG: Gfo/Idh/MocA family protein [Opitutales bacterium]